MRCATATLAICEPPKLILRVGEPQRRIALGLRPNHIQGKALKQVLFDAERANDQKSAPGQCVALYKDTFPYGNAFRHGLVSKLPRLRLASEPYSRQSLETGSLCRRACQRTKKTVPKWYCLFVGAPGRIRTCDLPVRSRALYPLSYGRKLYTVFLTPNYNSTTCSKCQELNAKKQEKNR